ncbi:hypothetical protein V8F20_005734, partial [Naviculisporaceae sp. PSN 640]
MPIGSVMAIILSELSVACSVLWQYRNHGWHTDGTTYQPTYPAPPYLTGIMYARVILVLALVIHPQKSNKGDCIVVCVVSGCVWCRGVQVG